MLNFQVGGPSRKIDSSTQFCAKGFGIDDVISGTLEWLFSIGPFLGPGRKSVGGRVVPGFLFTSIKWSDGHPIVIKTGRCPHFLPWSWKTKQLGTNKKNDWYTGILTKILNYVDKLSNKQNVKWILLDGYVELNLRSTFSISNRNVRGSSKSLLAMKDF